MLLLYWLLVVFVIGAIVGSFLNVAVARIPQEKSILWPNSRCGSCQQAIRWYDNLPIISYLWLRGRCRACGATFSPRYLLIELGTGFGFAVLFYLQVLLNIHHWPDRFPALVARGIFPPAWWLGWLHHAILFSFLLALALCDLQSREIPLAITVPGTIVGLIGSTLLPWPWPWTPLEATPRNPWQMPGGIKEGIQAWPCWGPLPDLLAPGGNWQTGLATGLAGLLVGTLLLRGVGFIASKGLGKDALGLGDADLMMMAGAFLGWQVIVVGFMLSVVPALLFGVINVLFRGDNSLPFGPSLAAGVLTARLGWNACGPYVQPIFFWGALMLGVIVVGAVLLLVISLLVRAARQLKA